MFQLRLLVFGFGLLGVTSGTSVACKKGQEACGWRCYDPATEECLTSSESDGRSLTHVPCRHGQKLCDNWSNWDCYSPETHACIPASNETQERFRSSEILCRIGLERCGMDCYSPATDSCHNGWLVCPLGEKACGYECYNPVERNCFTREADTELTEGWFPAAEQLCDKSQELCKWQCYNPSEEADAGRRCTETGAICGANEEGCGPLSCYDPSTGDKKCFSNMFLCDKAEELCGHICYDPLTERCFDEEKKACIIVAEPCGKSICYWMHNETCPTGHPTVCPNSLSDCGDQCYDPATHACFEYEGVQFVCPAGQAACGQTCYNPNVVSRPRSWSQAHVCFNGTTLCKAGQAICDWKCYNPGEGLVCHEPGDNSDAAAAAPILCKEGRLPCGCECYDPETQDCHQNSDNDSDGGSPTHCYYWNDEMY